MIDEARIAEVEKSVTDLAKAVVELGSAVVDLIGLVNEQEAELVELRSKLVKKVKGQ